MNTVGIAVFSVSDLKLPGSLETHTAVNTEWEYDLPYSDNSFIKKKKKVEWCSKACSGWNIVISSSSFCQD